MPPAGELDGQISLDGKWIAFQVMGVTVTPGAPFSASAPRAVLVSPTAASTPLKRWQGAAPARSRRLALE